MLILKYPRHLDVTHSFCAYNLLSYTLWVCSIKCTLTGCLLLFFQQMNIINNDRWVVGWFSWGLWTVTTRVMELHYIVYCTVISPCSAMFMYLCYISMSLYQDILSYIEVTCISKIHYNWIKHETLISV